MALVFVEKPSTSRQRIRALARPGASQFTKTAPKLFFVSARPTRSALAVVVVPMRVAWHNSLGKHCEIPRCPGNGQGSELGWP